MALSCKPPEIGNIPSGWAVSRLSRTSSVKTGPFGAQLHEKDYVSSGTPIVTVEHLGERGLIHKNLPLVSANDKARLSNYDLATGDIVFSRVGSVDRCSLVTSKENGWLFSGRLLRVRPNQDLVYPQFLIQYFQQAHFKQRVRRVSVGGTMPSLNTKLLSDMMVLLPPLPEQKTIAEILFCWDAAIEQTTRLVEAKMSLRKGLVQQLLTGKKRLPAFKKVSRRLLRKHFYCHPADWIHPRIREIAREVLDRNSRRQDMPVLLCSKYQGLVISREYFGKQVHSEDTSAYKIVRRGQFCYPANHVEEGSIGLLDRMEAGVVSPIYIVFAVDEKKVHAPYLYALFKTETYRHIFAVTTNSSVDRRGSLRWKEFSAIPVPLPPLVEQLEICRLLACMDKELELLRRKLDSLKFQKRGLMQKLLMGQIRVKEARNGRA